MSKPTAISQVRYQPKGQTKRKTSHRRNGFRPSEQQVQNAQWLIIRVLKRGRLYACNLKNAAHELLNRFGRDAHRLGRTIEEKAITVMRGLADLTRVERVAYDGRAYQLV